MSKTMKLLIPLLLIAIFVVSYAALADDSSPGNSTSTGDQNSSSTGDHQEHNGVSDQQENSDARQVQVDYSKSDNSIEIQSTNNQNGTINNIHIEISASEGLSVNFQYSGRSLTSTTETHLQIKLKPNQLVEFLDNKTAGIPNAFDGNDTVLNSFNLSNANYTLSVTNTTVSNDTVWVMSALTTLSNNATLGFKFYVTNGYYLMAGNNTLAPNLIKFTVSLENYPFANPQSSIALRMIFKSDLQSRQVTNQTEDYTDGLTHNKESAVNFANGTTDGFFSWVDNYTVDGKSMPIVTSPSISSDREDNSYNQMYFTFVQGKNITWDPKLGVTRVTTSMYDLQQAILSSNALHASSTPGFELIAALLSISVISIYYKRRYKK